MLIFKPQISKQFPRKGALIYTLSTNVPVSLTIPWPTSGIIFFSHLLNCFFELINKNMIHSKIYLFLPTLGIYSGVTLSVHSTESLSVYYWLDHKDEMDPRAHNPVQKINTNTYTLSV